MSDAANNVRVCLRVRPLLNHELVLGETMNATALPDGQTVRVMTNQNTYNKQLEAHQYRLDMCCGPDMTQREFFHHSGVESFCDSAIEGQAATVFCFGQTGSGKTYTMSGPHMADHLSPAEQQEYYERMALSFNKAGGAAAAVEGGGGAEEEDDNAASTNAAQAALADADTMGLQYRGVHYIAAAVKRMNEQIVGDLVQKGAYTREQLKGFSAITMRASYVEIYQEQVNDLLNGTENLKVRWAQGAQSFFIEHLMIVTCDDVTDLLAVLGEGGANRKRAAHKLNVDSSRSHVLFTIYFERKDGPSAPSKYGKINFVDLAGSERLKDSESTGVNADETKAINKSLFTLGKVISALSKQSALKNKSEASSSLDQQYADEVFVPYRDSALTKLLMDSLGGSCRTLMVACVTPAQRFTDESIRTIIYAMRTRNIVNSMPRVRMDPTQRQVYELKTEVDYLKKENAALKAKLRSFIEGGGGNGNNNSTLSDGDLLTLLGGGGTLANSTNKANAIAAILANHNINPNSTTNTINDATIRHNYVEAEEFTANSSNAAAPPLPPPTSTNVVKVSPRGNSNSNATAAFADAAEPTAVPYDNKADGGRAVAVDGNSTTTNNMARVPPSLQHLQTPRGHSSSSASATPSLPPIGQRQQQQQVPPIAVKANNFMAAGVGGGGNAMSASNAANGLSPQQQQQGTSVGGAPTPRVSSRVVAGGLPPVHSASNPNSPKPTGSGAGGGLGVGAAASSLSPAAGRIGGGRQPLPVRGAIRANAINNTNTNTNRPSPPTVGGGTTTTTISVSSAAPPPRQAASGGGSRAANPSLLRKGAAGAGAGGGGAGGSPPAAKGPSVPNSAPTTLSTEQHQQEQSAEGDGGDVVLASSTSQNNPHYHQQQQQQEYSEYDENAEYVDGSTQVPSIHGGHSRATNHTVNSSPPSNENTPIIEKHMNNMHGTASKTPTPPPSHGANHSRRAGGGGDEDDVNSANANGNARRSTATDSYASEGIGAGGGGGGGNASPALGTRAMSKDGTVLAAAWANQPTMSVANLKDFGFKPAAKKGARML